MRKLVIFVLITALVAGAAFAEVNASAWLRGRVNVVAGDSDGRVNEENKWVANDLKAGYPGNYHDFRFVASGENDDGTFGGLVRFRDVGPNVNAFGDSFGWVWWKPIDFLRIQIGKNAFNDFADYEVVRSSSFYGAGNDAGMGVANIFAGVGASNANLEDAFSFFGQGGAELSLYPIEGLTLNFGFPYEISNTNADAIYGNMMAQAQYKIEDIGRLTVAFHAKNANDTNYTSGNHAVHLGFFLTAVENLQVNLGLKFMMPYVYEVKDVFETTVNYPFLIALGAAFDAGDFNFKARCQVSLGITTVTTFKASGVDDVKYYDPTYFYIELLPSYDIGPCRLNLSVGLNITGFDADDKIPDPKDPTKEISQDPVIAFGINPYVSKTVGSGNFYAGFKLTTNGQEIYGEKGDEAKIEWSIPVGMVVSF